MANHATAKRYASPVSEDKPARATKRIRLTCRAPTDARQSGKESLINANAEETDRSSSTEESNEECNQTTGLPTTLGIESEQSLLTSTGTKEKKGFSDNTATPITDLMTEEHGVDTQQIPVSVDLVGVEDHQTSSKNIPQLEETKTVVVLNSLQRVPGSTFASILAKAKEPEGKYDGPYLEDLENYHISTLPDKCEVTDESLQDELLKPDYVDLPNLRRGTFVSWAPQATGSGHPVFTEFWGNTISNMRLWNCIDALQFTQTSRYINPSRISPMLVHAKNTNGNDKNKRLYVHSKSAICISSLCVTDSFIHRLPPTGLSQKQIRGIVHSQEWERLVAFFCMAFGQHKLHAQLYKDAMSFTTKTADSPNFAPSVGFKQSATAKSSSTSSKTDKQKKSYQTFGEDKFVLECDNEIPVYDARDTDFNLRENIENIKNLLPSFEGEIPRSSFVVVAYTAASYHSRKNDCWHISTNIQWVIVFGIPA